MFLLSFGTKFDNSTLLVVEKIAILDLVGLCKIHQNGGVSKISYNFIKISCTVTMITCADSLYIVLCIAKRNFVICAPNMYPR